MPPEATEATSQTNAEVAQFIHLKPLDTVTLDHISSADFANYDVFVIGSDFILRSDDGGDVVVFPNIGLYLFSETEAPKIYLSDGAWLTPGQLLQKLGEVKNVSDSSILSFTSLEDGKAEMQAQLSEEGKLAKERLEVADKRNDVADKKIEAAKKLIEEARETYSKTQELSEIIDQNMQNLQDRELQSGEMEDAELLELKSLLKEEQEKLEDFTQEQLYENDYETYYESDFVDPPAVEQPYVPTSSSAEAPEIVVPNTSSFTMDLLNVARQLDASGDILYGGGGSETSTFDPSASVQGTAEAINTSFITGAHTIFADNRTFFAGTGANENFTATQMARTARFSFDAGDGFSPTTLTLSLPSGASLPSGFQVFDLQTGQFVPLSGNSFTVSAADFSAGYYDLVFVYDIQTLPNQTFEFDITMDLAFDPASGFPAPADATETLTDNYAFIIRDINDPATDYADPIFNVLANNPNANNIVTGDGGATVYGAQGQDTIVGGGGDDLFYGNAGNDALDGAEGADSLFGEVGDDTLKGEGGNDALDGGAGNDEIFGGIGNDTIADNMGDDFVDGGSGDDLFIASAGLDTIEGGAGSDSVDYSAKGSLNVDLSVVDMNTGYSELTYDNGVETNQLSGVENVTSGNANDTIGGNDADNILISNDGDDSLIASAGNDVLDGGAGSDSVDYSYLNDTVVNPLQEGVSLDVLPGSVSHNSLGNDTVSNVENFTLTALDDTVIADAGNFVSVDAGANTTLSVTYDGSGLIPASIAGGDLLDLSNLGASDVYSVDLLSGVSSINSASGTLSGFEHVVVGDAAGGSILATTSTAAHSIQAGAGMDTISLGSGANIVDSGAGDDSVTTLGGNDNITSMDGNNVIDAGSGINLVNTGGGNDTIVTGGGNDTVHAGDGNNGIASAGGNNEVTSGVGMDTIATGAGDDSVTIDGGSNLVNVGDGANIVDVLTGIATNINDITSGAGNDSITVVGESNDTIVAGNGDNIITSTGGNNEITSGTGLDVITTGAGNDEIHAGDGDNIIRAGEGINEITSGDGMDDILTGAGDDSVTIDGGSNLVDVGDGVNEVDILAGTVTDTNNVTSGTGDDSITIIGESNDAINTGAGDDVIDAGNGINVINAGEGQNNITSGTGNDVITSGAGNDTVTVTGGNNSINVGEGDNVVSTGGGVDAVITGSGADSVSLGAGNDSIVIAGGNDTLDGGAGAQDAVDYSALTAGLNVNLAGSATTNVTGAITGGVSNFEIIDLTTFNDSLALDNVDSNYVIDALAGEDTLDLSAVMGTAVTTDLAAGSVAQGANTMTAANFEHVIGSNAHDDITGTEMANTITGGGGNDTIDAGAENDTIDAGADNDSIIGNDIDGNDSLDGGAGIDILDYSAVTADMSVDLGAEIASGAGLDTIQNFEDVISGAGNDVVTGNNLNNLLVTGDGNDVLVGGDGNDVLNGGAGNDTANYAYAAEGIVADLDAGIVIVNGSDNDTLVSIEDIQATNFDDSITGNAGDNHISGFNGDDTLIGGAGNDTLVDGLGSDSLIGGAGDDVFSMSGDNSADSADGGVGDNTVSYANANVNMDIDLGLQTATTGSTVDVVNNFNHAEGGLGNDTLVGNADDNNLTGGEGNDVFIVTVGDDSFNGGNGIDTADFSLSSGIEATLTAVSESADGVVNTTINTTNYTNTITSIENIIGTAMDDVFNFTTTAATGIDAGAGTDIVSFAGGALGDLNAGTLGGLLSDIETLDVTGLSGSVGALGFSYLDVIGMTDGANMLTVSVNDTDYLSYVAGGGVNVTSVVTGANELTTTFTDGGTVLATIIAQA